MGVTTAEAKILSDSETPDHSPPLETLDAILDGVRAGGRLPAGVTLRDAKLIGRNLAGANLAGVDLRGADLSRADLTKANLVGAQLEGAVLFGATLDQAELLKANLRGADLTQCARQRVLDSAVLIWRRPTSLAAH